MLKCGYERFCGMFLFIQGENNDTKHIKGSAIYRVNTDRLEHIGCFMPKIK